MGQPHRTNASRGLSATAEFLVVSRLQYPFLRVCATNYEHGTEI